MNPELIKSLEESLKSPRGTLEAFRLNLSVDEAYRLLLAAYTGQVLERQQQYRTNADTLAALSSIASALVNPEGRFGIVLAGTVGNGKTTALRAIQRVISRLNIPDHSNPNRIGWLSMPVYKASAIVQMWEDNPTQFRELCSSPLLGIDELGEENVDVRRYGNFATPICDLIYHRYDRRLFTAITTNLGNSIRERYGDRIADRLNEMVVKIVFRSQSFRGQY